MNENANVLEEIKVEDVIDVCEELTAVPGKTGIAAKVAGVLLTAGITVGAIVYSKKEVLKEKSNNRKIKKLEKQGYTVTAPEAPVEDEAIREDETE